MAVADCAAVVFTQRRLRSYTVLIGVGLWAVWAIDISNAGVIDRLGKVKGTDFLHFYVLGAIAHEGKWGELYDARAQLARTRAIAPASDETLFLPVEGPQLALLFAPFARFSYLTALSLWLAAGALLYAGACLLLWRDCPGLQRHTLAVAAACAGFPGFFNAILHGQTAWLSLALVVTALAALRRGHRFAAGFALGSLVFKPHWALAAGVVFLGAREWKVVWAIGLAAAAQLAVTCLAVGPAVMLGYAHVISTLPRIAPLLEPNPVDSLKGYFQLVTPWTAAAGALYAMAAAAVIGIAARIWRGRGPLDLRLAAMVLAMILVCPHVNSYDLLLAAPVLFLLTAWLAGSDDPHPWARPVPFLLAGLFVAPVLTSLPPVVRLQFSVGVPAVLLWVLARIFESQPNQLTRRTSASSISVISSSFASSAANPH